MRPRAGDIWTIPAGVRAVVCTRANGKFCAIALPNGTLGHRELASRIQSRDPFLSQVIEQIAQIVDRDDPATHPLRESLIETVGLHLKDQYCDGLPAPGHARLDPVTQAAIRELLEDGFDSEITLSALADLAGLPVRSLRAAFGATFGTTPHQYILDGRIARAQTLLATMDHHDVLGVVEPPARRRFEGLGYEGELHARGGYAFCWRVCGSSGYRNHGRRRAAVGSCGVEAAIRGFGVRVVLSCAGGDAPLRGHGYRDSSGEASVYPGPAVRGPRSSTRWPTVRWRFTGVERKTRRLSMFSAPAVGGLGVVEGGHWVDLHLP